MSALQDDNICWEPYPVEVFPDGFEPWEPDEDDIHVAGGCAYCPETEVRERPEPFGGQLCCEACFNMLIGGDPDDPPWRCGTVPLMKREAK